MLLTRQGLSVYQIRNIWLFLFTFKLLTYIYQILTTTQTTYLCNLISVQPLTACC